MFVVFAVINPIKQLVIFVQACSKGSFKGSGKLILLPLKQSPYAQSSCFAKLKGN